MTGKEKRELKDGVISIFKRFNILNHTATIGNLRDDILKYINSLQEEHVSDDLEEVDLEKEVTNQIRLLSGVHTLYDGKQWWKGTYNELSYFAKYFFELGLNTQKGE